MCVCDTLRGSWRGYKTVSPPWHKGEGGGQIDIFEQNFTTKPLASILQSNSHIANDWYDHFRQKNLFVGWLYFLKQIL